MIDDESIDSMLTHFNKITNGHVFLGKEIRNNQKVRKIFRSLPKSWKVKTAILKKVNDKEMKVNDKEINLIEFKGNLKT